MISTLLTFYQIGKHDNEVLRVTFPYFSLTRAQHRLRVLPAVQAGPATPRRPREAAQGGRPEESGRPGRGSVRDAQGSRESDWETGQLLQLHQSAGRYR